MLSSFPYQWFPRGDISAGRTVIKDSKILRPLLTATLIRGGTNLPIDALVDSGSDKTISFAQFGTLMGIDFYNEDFRKDMQTKTGMEFEQDIFGLGKVPIPAFLTLIEIEVNGKRQMIKMYWIREAFKQDTDFALILGQDSVFYLFDIHFSKRQHKFFLNDQVFTP